jgi:two-component system chemotaxis sensor kinase CheA
MKNDFLKKLLATFRIEADEHVGAMSSLLVEMEKTPDVRKRSEALESVFREAHSLKGAARSVSMKEIESLCQPLESVFSELKTNRIALTPELFDLLHETVDCLRRFLSSGETEWKPEEKSKAVTLIRQLREAAEETKIEKKSGGQRPGIREQETGVGDQGSGIRDQEAGVGELKYRDESPPSMEPVSSQPAAIETVRISTAKLDSLFLQAEELLSVKLATSQRAADLQDISAMLDSWKKERSKIDPDVRAARYYLEKSAEKSPRKSDMQLSVMLEFLERNQNYIKLLESKLGAIVKSTEYDSHSHNRMVDDLLHDMKRALMLPFSSLLEIFPKLVRDLSREQGKDMELVVQGKEVEIDRRILEAMKDPLIHLVRNCIDHGIESQKERLGKKKPARGTILIAVSSKDSSSIEIAISDDGAGIDAARVRAAALKQGILVAEDAAKLNETQTLSLIYHSGVSTSPIVTDVSGRGLGLAIVRERVERLGGVISLDTQPDSGTTFRIVLPMTLAAFRGVLVGTSERLFVIPTTSVDRVTRVSREDIKTVENRETILFNGQTIPLVRLSDALGIPRKIAAASHGEPGETVVVLTSAEKRIAFTVDEIVNEQEILVKSLGRQLARVRNVAGSTVLGSGETVLILNVPDLLETAVKAGAAPSVAAEVTEEVEPKEKSILVVEDSITARSLLKNILESAGYHVRTAVDGVDGFTTLKEGMFDLVVSDVDMPRMNGFDFTAKIRADKRLSELPVVLVTALQSREDRERGIDAGADAYIVKSSFDQSNLLEIVRRLL